MNVGILIFVGIVMLGIVLFILWCKADKSSINRCDNFIPIEKDFIENCGNCKNWNVDEGKCKVLGR
jgi:hypothetical protein